MFSVISVDIIRHISEFLPPADLMRASLTCRRAAYGSEESRRKAMTTHIMASIADSPAEVRNVYALARSRLGTLTYIPNEAEGTGYVFPKMTRMGNTSIAAVMRDRWTGQHGLVFCLGGIHPTQQVELRYDAGCMEATLTQSVRDMAACVTLLKGKGVGGWRMLGPSNIRGAYLSIHQQFVCEVVPREAYEGLRILGEELYHSIFERIIQGSDPYFGLISYNEYAARKQREREAKIPQDLY